MVKVMHEITVSLVFALPERQWVYEARVPRGHSAAELVDQSGFLTEITFLKNKSVKDLALGVFAQPIRMDYLLEEGDRVEIYRPLTADPKEVRRQLALLGKTMGKK